MSYNQTQHKDRVESKITEPKQYKVIMYNDDFTTTDFVVRILKQIFFMPEKKAYALMLQVHHSDNAVIGVYTYDVAMSKVRKATDLAREKGFPLRLTVKPE